MIPIVSRRQILINGACLLFLVICAFYGVRNWKTKMSIDYYQFWITGQAVSSMELTNIYSRDQRALIRQEFLNRARATEPPTKGTRIVQQRSLNLAGTPFLYSVFYLFSSGQYALDYEVFRLLSLFAFMGAIAYLCLFLEFTLGVAFLAPIFFTVCFWPFKLDVRIANVNQLQVGMMALFIFFQTKWNKSAANYLSGALLGFYFLFKPTLVYATGFLFLSWILAGRTKLFFRALAGAIVAVLISLLLPILLFGSACSWLSWWKGFKEIVFINHYFSQSLLGILFNIRNESAHSFFGLFIFGFTLFLLKRMNGTPRFQSDLFVRMPFPLQDYFMYSLGIIVYILTGPLVHKHYFVLMVPPLLFMLRPFLPRHGFRSYWTPRHFWGLVALTMISAWLRPNFWTYKGTFEWSYAGTLILFALSIWEILLPRLSNTPSTH